MIAKIKLPKVVEREVFNKLVAKFNYVQEDTLARACEEDSYDYPTSTYITRYVVMKQTEKYEDECTKTEDGNWVCEGSVIESYRVRKRPSKDMVVILHTNVVMDINVLYSVVPNIQITVDYIIPVTNPNEFEAFYQLSREMNNLAKKIELIENNNFSFNQKCDVHVPNLGLLQIDTVRIFEDCCTEELQTYLNEGWRIIAACPQPDQRRPDYILGKISH